MEDGDRCLGGLCMWSDIRRVKNVCWRSGPVRSVPPWWRARVVGRRGVRRMDDVRATCGIFFNLIRYASS